MVMQNDGDRVLPESAERTEILAYLHSALRTSVDADEDIFESGLVTSLFALELVTFVESRFGIPIEVEDLELDNFRTAERIEALVRRKRAAAGPPGD